MQEIPTLRGPKRLQLLQWLFDPRGYLEAGRKQCGDIFAAYIRPDSLDPLILIGDPESIQYILANDNNRQFSVPGELNHFLAPLIGEQGVLMLSGERHSRRRKLLMPPFRAELIKSYSQLIQDIAQATMLETGFKPFDARIVMQEITQRVILQIVFGLAPGDRYSALVQAIDKRYKPGGSPLVMALEALPIIAERAANRDAQRTAVVDKLLLEEIARRRSKADDNRTDILSLLLMAHDEEGNGLSDSEIRDELLTQLVGGRETTAGSLAWALYWIHKLPKVKEKLMRELVRLSPNGDPSQFLQLPFLDAVCNETLRIFPSAQTLLPRQAERPVRLGGYDIRPGTHLFGSPYLVHHREEIYPQPKQFRPERLLGKQFGPGEFIPFGGGARSCIGKALAYCELKVVLGTILTQNNLTLLNRRSVQAGRQGFGIGPISPINLQRSQANDVR